MSLLAAFAVPHPPVLLPEVGRGEEKKIGKTADAYRAAMRRAAALRPDTVIVTSPHAVLYADYFHLSPGAHARGDFSAFGAPQVRVEADYDTAFVEKFSDLAEEADLPAGTLGGRDRALDHGTAIPLHFLNEFWTDYRLVRVGLSGLPPMAHYRLGRLLSRTAEALGRRAVLIASGDLSHKLLAAGPYGFAPEGPRFDREVTRALGAGDFLALLRLDPAFCESAAECGLRSFWIMAGALDGRGVQSELLSYEGPFGVGYGVAAFRPGDPDPARRFGEIYEREERARAAQRRRREDAYVRLARLSLETYVAAGHGAPLPDGLPAELIDRRAGVFVSLKKQGRLRGCIGTVTPVTASVAEEILRNAVSAGTEDPRFPPVAPEELPELQYSVDVLGAAEDIDSPAALDPRRYGVIVSAGPRQGLLLPDLAGVDTPAQQIDIARHKAGIGPREPVTLQRFEVVRHL